MNVFVSGDDAMPRTHRPDALFKRRAPLKQTGGLVEVFLSQGHRIEPTGQHCAQRAAPYARMPNQLCHNRS
jgi:hypothetical protein